MNNLVPKNPSLPLFHGCKRWRGSYFLVFAALSSVVGGCQYLSELAADEKIAASGRLGELPGPEHGVQAVPVMPAPAAEFQVGHWRATGSLTTPAETALVETVQQITDSLTLEIQVNEAGRVVGKVSCGELQAELSGVFDEEQIRADFSGERMTGTLLAVRKDEEFRGVVRVSLVERIEMREKFSALIANLSLQKE